MADAAKAGNAAKKALLSDCAPAGTGVTDAGKLVVAAAWQVAAAALAAANIAVSAHLAAKQFELARRYFQIARNWHDWYTTGFIPLEDQEAAEAMGLGKTEPHYDMAVGRAMVLPRLALADQPKAALRCLPCYATGLRSAVVHEAARALDDSLAVNAALGWRNERARVEARNDRRCKRLETVAARGRSISSQNIAYGRLAAGIYGSLSDQAARAARGYLGFIATARSRFRTDNPPGFRQPRLAEDYVSGWFRRGEGKDDAREAKREAVRGDVIIHPFVD